MISKAPYSTDENEVRTVNKADNVIILSLIRYHGRIPLDLVRYNKDTYALQSTQHAQDSRIMYEFVRYPLTKEGLEKVNIWGN